MSEGVVEPETVTQTPDTQPAVISEAVPAESYTAQAENPNEQ